MESPSTEKVDLSSPSFLATNASITPELTRQNSWSGASQAYSDDSDLLGMHDRPYDDHDAHQDPTSALTDLVNTFWSPPRIDLDALDRKLKLASQRVRQTVAKQRARTSGHDQQHTSGTLTPHHIQHHRELALEEVRRMRAIVALRVDKLSKRWAEQKIVRLRDKISFVIGVMNLVCSSLLFALKPEWMYIAYTVQCAFFLPLRILSYYHLNFHYFLFDYCYFANLLNLAFIWLFPDNKFLFLACYCSSHGPLAFSIATWRNSAVFHSLEKMTSLFIHLYPPITFCAMRHFMPTAVRNARFPAIEQLPELNSLTAFAWNVTFYLVWQLTYYLFISRSKAHKIASGERVNSYSHMSKGKGAVAKVLARAPLERREWAFIALQFVYTIVCTLPAPLLFYNNSRASAVFCLLLILLSVWNGATYYVEVWGRRFERELEQLRKEVESTQRIAASAEERSTSTKGSDQGGDAQTSSSEAGGVDDRSQDGREKKEQ